MGSTKDLEHKATNALKQMPSGEVSVKTGFIQCPNTAIHLKIKKANTTLAVWHSR